jgi:putative methionine-R-sulfoxide reductase with GAF domain
MSAHTGALEAIDRILNRGGDADDILRAVVSVLYERVDECSWVGIYFVEGEQLLLGPSRGDRTSAETRVPIAYDGRVVAELAVSETGDRAFLERVALLISPHCLVGWDTRGEAWSP